jgi:hypothetical protein
MSNIAKVMKADFDEIRKRAEFWPPSIMDQSMHLEIVQADTLVLLAKIEQLRAAATRALDALNELIGADYDVTGEIAELKAALE